MNQKRIRRFREMLRRFERVFSRQLKHDSCCSGVTLAQCHVLLEIDATGETSLKELAEKLKLDKSTLSRTVDGLFNSKQLARKPHPSDRRITLLTLTEQGQKTADRINADNDAYYAGVIEAVPPKKQEEVIGSFELMVKALEDAQTACCHAETQCRKTKKGK